MRPPTELGRLITSHHPINPFVALAICCAPGLLIAAGLLLGPTHSLTLGVYAFVLTSVLLVGLFAESLFVRQQVFEHGLLLGSIVPATPSYVIPYESIDPDSITAGAYRRTGGAADITDAFSRHYRQAPTVDSVAFVAVSPALARDAAKRPYGWGHAATTASELPARLWPRSPDFERWYVGFHDTETSARGLRDRVHRHPAGTA